jgi:hypothetical protein
MPIPPFIWDLLGIIMTLIVALFLLVFVGAIIGMIYVLRNMGELEKWFRRGEQEGGQEKEEGRD